MHAAVTQYCHTCRKQTGYGANTELLFFMHWKQSVSVLLNLNVPSSLSIALRYGVICILFRTYTEVVKTNVMHSWMSLVDNCFHMKQELIT
jgi:hypothetical protein